MKKSLWVTIRQWFVNQYRAHRYYNLLKGISANSTHCNMCQLLAGLARDTTK